VQELALLQPPVPMSGCWPVRISNYLDPSCALLVRSTTLRLPITLLVLLSLPVALAAQLAPLGVPKGNVRMDIGGDFAWAHDRYNDGTRESLSGSLTSPALGQVAIPTLADADNRLAILLGIGNYQMNLGRSTGNAQFSRTSGALGLALGITKNVTLYGRMAIVDAWNRQKVSIDTLNNLGDAGVNLASPVLGDATGQGVADQFFSSFEGALSTLEARIAAGDYDGNPAVRDLAIQTLASGRAFEDSLQALVLTPETAAPFLPLLSSVPGSTLGNRVTSLQQTLSNTLGVAGFTEAIPLPELHATGDDVHRYATAPNGPVAYTNFSNNRLTAPGDVTVGAVITAVDRWNPATARGVRVAIDGSALIPTGDEALPGDALRTSTGAGTTVLRGLAAVDLGWGAMGMRLQGGYTARMSTTVTRRVGTPVEALVPAFRTANLEQSGGGEFRVGVQPYIRLARAFGVVLSADYLNRSEEQFTYATAADSVPGIPAALLNSGTGASRVVLGVGMAYSGIGGRPDTSKVQPLDAGWKWETVIASSGGIVTKWTAVQVFFRYYAKIW